MIELEGFYKAVLPNVSGAEGGGEGRLNRCSAEKRDSRNESTQEMLFLSQRSLQGFTLHSVVVTRSNYIRSLTGNA
jgi:hypothetical protein